MSKKILLMYITKRSGHHSASLAVEQALKSANPDLEILNINAFNYTNPILEKVINRTYMGIVKTRPEVWDYLYDNPRVLRSTLRLRELIHKFNSRRLKELLEDFKPDAIACTQAFPCGMVADYKKTYKYEAPLFGILTDYAPHSYWVYDNINGYIVPSEETGRRLIENGIKRERVHAFGIPVKPKFRYTQDCSGIMNRLGLDPKAYTILIMGGGQGLGPIRHIVSDLDNLKDINLQVIVVTGTNASLYTYFKKTQKSRKKRIAFLSYTDNIDELMQISSLIVSKPGGVTTAEALAKCLPILIVHPLPGQEAMNTARLLSMEVALKAEDYRDVIVLIKALLSLPAKLSQMREKIKKHAKPDSAIRAAELILRSIEK